MIPTADALSKGLIVSVQAPLGSPMRDPDVIASMAEASLRNGAVGVRLESPEHIGAVRRRCPEASGQRRRTAPMCSGLSKRTPTAPLRRDASAMDAITSGSRMGEPKGA